MCIRDSYETVQANGYWYPEKQPGDPFFQGELLGRVESGEGETLQAITAPFDGVVLYQTHILGVSQGMPLLAYGKLRAEGGGFPARKQKGCYDREQKLQDTDLYQ